MSRFIIKKVEHKASKKLCNVIENNKINENKDMMTTEEKVRMAQEILGNESEAKMSVKRLKKDNGLIEKVNTKKIILTEENKELLND